MQSRWVAPPTNGHFQGENAKSQEHQNHCSKKGYSDYGPTKSMDEFLDGFSGHKDREDRLQKIANALKRSNVHVETLPPNCTPILQPINEDGYTTDTENSINKIRPPSKQQVVEWVEEAWYETTEVVVKKSFLCTGIANNLDGSEDFLNTVDLDRPL